MSQMDDKLRTDLLSRLLRDYSFKDPRNGKLHGGVCPNCGKKELWAYADNPWKISCNRINKCGFEASVRDLYPDAFASWSDRFQATPQNPHAAADAYLTQARHLDIAPLKGHYTQGTFYDPASGHGSATVRFELEPGVTWERIIDRPERFGRQKGRANGSYKGKWWCPPQLNLADLPSGGDLWITEGIFDALALTQNGLPAVAAISCVNYPSVALTELAKQCVVAQKTPPRLIFALDGDRAGLEWMAKLAARARHQGFDATAAYIPVRRGGKKVDWNDAHIAGLITPKDDGSRNHRIADYLHAGAVLLANSAIDKAFLISAHKSLSSFALDFGNRLYWFKLDLEKYNKVLEELRKNNDDRPEPRSDEQLREAALRDSGNLTEICNAAPEILYFQSNAATDESWYYLQVAYPPQLGAPTIKAAFTGGQLAAAAEFKKRLLSVASGAVWAGSTQQLDALVKRQAEGLRHVQTIDFVGYSKEHAAYVFQNVAVKGGKTYTLNEEDFFDIHARNADGKHERLSIKTTSLSVPLHLNPEEALDTFWCQLLATAFGARGLVALAYWLGTLFACQIRERHKSWPFLEVVGKAGSGKTALVEFLWKLLGRSDYEGFDPKKSSLAGRSRSMSQVSNMPIVFIEADRNDNHHDRPFDWEELKTAYNGRASSVKGVKNSGNETKEPEFKGALVISQNSPVQSHEAIMERIVGMEFDKSNHTPAGKTAADTLSSTPVERLSSFMLHALRRESAVLEAIFQRAPQFEEELLQHGYTRNIRIAKNHSQIMACLCALPIVLGQGAFQSQQFDAALQLLRETASAREKACRADISAVQEFWDAFDYLDGQTSDDGFGAAVPLLNHSSDPNIIAINLPHFAQVCAERRISVPDSLSLKRSLKESRSRRFIGVETVHSVIHAAWNKRRRDNQVLEQGASKPLSIKCWLFEREKKPTS